MLLFVMSGEGAISVDAMKLYFRFWMQLTTLKSRWVPVRPSWRPSLKKWNRFFLSFYLFSFA